MSDSNVQNTQPTSQEISAPSVETPVTNTSNSTPGTTSESVPVPTNAPSVEASEQARNPEELMKLVMKQESENVEYQSKLAELQAKYDQMVKQQEDAAKESVISNTI